MWGRTAGRSLDAALQPHRRPAMTLRETSKTAGLLHEPSDAEEKVCSSTSHVVLLAQLSVVHCPHRWLRVFKSVGCAW